MHDTSRGSVYVSHNDQGQVGARRAQNAGFHLGAKEAEHRCGVPRNQTRVSILVQQDQDRQDSRTEVIAEPTTTSRAEALQAKTTFRQDKTYYLPPFKIGHYGIPSRLRL